MHRYRACTVGEGGDLIRFRAFVCSSDEDAIVSTKHLLDGHPIELWRDERFIVRVE
jgi:hypothetical protein